MSKKPNHVIVHPLVLLSVVDHYTRIHADKKNRAVGVLLGSVSKGVVDITNSFAGKKKKRKLKFNFFQLHSKKIHQILQFGF